MQAVAVAWQMYSLTKDPLSLGLIGLAEVVPAIGFSLFAGHVVDRNDRKYVALFAFLLTTMTTITLWLLSSGFFELSTKAVVYGIYAAVFISGVARAFLGSSLFAFFGQIIDREHYVRASAWSSTSWQIAASVGPALGGLIYGYGGAHQAYTAALILLVLGIGFLAQIPSRGKIHIDPNKEPFLQSLTVGLRFVFNRPVVLSALSLDLFAVLFGGAVALLPLFADLLQVGPEGLGLLRAAPSVGAALMAFFFIHHPPSRNAGRVLLWSVAGFGLCMISFALSKNFYFSLLILAVSGALDAVSVMVRSAIVQLMTPETMRGRVSAVNSIFIMSSNELGAFESGVAAKWLGTIPSVVFGGCMTMLVVATTAVLSPQMRKFDLSAQK